MVNATPKLVVGLDFGTTFSGFAFAHTANPDMVHIFYDYPKVGYVKPYCKTRSGSYYKNVGGAWQFTSWGYPARFKYDRDIQKVRKLQRASMASDDPLQPTVGKYLTNFKLHLASKDMPGGTSVQALLPPGQGQPPPGLTIHDLITDYLREMGALILKALQNHYGSAQITKQEILWCITVPSIWDNAAKATMKMCMTSAGLVNGDDGSPHPLVMVLEPEAASFYCHKVIKNVQVLGVGDMLLVADVGGGTSDIVVQEVVSVGLSGYRVREVTTSSGGLCGGAFVDARFMEFLHKTIGPCLQECIIEKPSIYSKLIQIWEQAKANFGDSLVSDGESCTDITLPRELVSKWEKYDQRMGEPSRDSYDELEISYDEMRSIFHPVVEANVLLILNQLEQVGASAVKLLVVVGGFASSPYLMDCIRRCFEALVPQIISPPDPGSAVCGGAVMLALNPDIVLSRVCKKTYGISLLDYFDETLDLPKYREEVDGLLRCRNRFEIYVRKGDTVDVNSCISKTFSPPYRGQRRISVSLFSSDERDPRYTVGEGVRKEGEIVIDISMDKALDTARTVKVSLYFGGSSMEIKAEAVNFSAGGPQQLDLPVEVGFC